MTTTTNESHPNEAQARREIDRAVAAANSSRSVISDGTARLIAATIHEGPGTALERFAATGQLDHAGASTELWDLPIDSVPADWWRAMDHFLDEEAHHE